MLKTHLDIFALHYVFLPRMNESLRITMNIHTEITQSARRENRLHIKCLQQKDSRYYTTKKVWIDLEFSKWKWKGGSSLFLNTLTTWIIKYNHLQLVRSWVYHSWGNQGTPTYLLLWWVVLFWQTVINYYTYGLRMMPWLRFHILPDNAFLSEVISWSKRKFFVICVS